MAHRDLLFLWDFGPDRVHLSCSFLLDHPKSMPMYTISKIVPLASNFMSFFNTLQNIECGIISTFQEASGMLVYEYGQ